jgi:plasmid maintenance system antidote protein VapI
MAEEMLTAKKVADKLGVKPKQVQDLIKAKGIEPDQTKGACKYYGKKTVAKIKKGLK